MSPCCVSGSLLARSATQGIVLGPAGVAAGRCDELETSVIPSKRALWRDDDWPEVKAAFSTAAVSVTDDGTIWVRRYVAAGSIPEYDVFDSRGQRIQTVVLRQNARVAGFGKGVVYVTRSDEYDLQWLQKHKR